jgi:hypothetical protein
MSFPQYRKYSDGFTFFCIHSSNEMDEIKRMGNYYSISHIQCKIHPEKMFLNDLIELSFPGIELSTENEFNSILNQWKSELKLFQP